MKGGSLHILKQIVLHNSYNRFIRKTVEKHTVLWVLLKKKYHSNSMEYVYGYFTLW